MQAALVACTLHRALNAVVHVQKGLHLSICTLHLRFGFDVPSVAGFRDEGFLVFFELIQFVDDGSACPSEFVNGFGE